MALAAMKFMDAINASSVMRGLNHPIFELDYREIGENVYAGSISKEMLNDVTAVCRRRFKKDDVLVYVDTDEDEEYGSGIVFTQDILYTWSDNGGSVEEVAYDSIKSVDYDEDSVTITYDGGTCTLYLGENAEDEKYPRYMYNFIMDIIELDGKNAMFWTPAKNVTKKQTVHENQISKVSSINSYNNREKYVNDWVIKVVEHMDGTGDALIDSIKMTVSENSGFELTEENVKKLENYLKASGCSGIKTLVNEAYDFLDIYVWSGEEA